MTTAIKSSTIAPSTATVWLPGFLAEFESVIKMVPKLTTSEILLESNGGAITLMATDGENFIQKSYESSGDSFRVAVPAKQMIRMLRELDGKELAITVSLNEISVSSGGSKFTIRNDFDPGEFRTMPNVWADFWLTLDGPTLRSMIEKTIFACDKFSTRYAFGGVQIEIKRHQLNLAATDSRRLCVISCDCEADKEIAAVAPRKALRAIAANLVDGPCKIAFDDNRICVRQGAMAVCGDLLQGRFPDWRNAIPKEFKGRASINVAALLAIMKRAAMVGNDEDRGSDWRFTEGTLFVAAGACDGKFESSIRVEYDGPELTMTMDARMIVDMLEAVGADVVEVNLIAEDGPMMFSSGEYRYVVMPLSD